MVASSSALHHSQCVTEGGKAWEHLFITWITWMSYWGRQRGGEGPQPKQLVSQVRSLFRTTGVKIFGLQTYKTPVFLYTWLKLERDAWSIYHVNDLNVYIGVALYPGSSTESPQSCSVSQRLLFVYLCSLVPRLLHWCTLRYWGTWSNPPGSLSVFRWRSLGTRLHLCRHSNHSHGKCFRHLSPIFEVKNVFCMFRQFMIYL